MVSALGQIMENMKEGVSLLVQSVPLHICSVFCTLPQAKHLLHVIISLLQHRLLIFSYAHAIVSLPTPL